MKIMVLAMNVLICANPCFVLTKQQNLSQKLNISLTIFIP